MRIKKIELVGFKSFKDRTVIQFDAGITGIVGPNGCGKSNIVDALVWVMGEMSAKDLRGSTMTDVIFAGADGYSALGMCEVSLTLENDGGAFPAKYLKFSEIMVTRRLYRSGEGEYFINKEPSRLKDVQEIFMDTGAGSKGFSIIQQGMIGKIITSKPEDRRHLIEEAAGITKFKARKKESQRKLQATDQNLVRLQDIIGELKRQIDSLHRQAQRAERYRNIKTQIEDLELWFSSKQYADLKNTADEAQKIFNDAQGLEFESESSIAGLQSEFETLKLLVLEKEKNIEVFQSDYYQKQSDLQKRELELTQLKFEIEQARKNEQMTGSLLSEQNARLELLEKEDRNLSSQLAELEKEATELKAAYEEKNAIYSESQEKIQTVDQELTDERRELFALGQTATTVELKIGNLEQMITQQNEKIDESGMLLQELQEKLEEYAQRKKKVINDFEKERQLHMDLSSDVDSFEANKKILTEQVASKKIEIDAFKDELNQVTSRLYGLENLHSNFEGFEDGVKSIMLWQKKRVSEASAGAEADGGIFQPLSEVVEVPTQYEVAMESILGTKLQLLTGEKSEDALSALDYLKSQKSGRGSFMAVEHAHGHASSHAASGKSSRNDLAAKPGVIALLSDTLKAGEKHQAMVNQLLGNVAVVESLASAMNLHQEFSDFDFVTMDGDVFSREGIITGGANEAANSGVLKRKREIKELSQKKDEWSGKLSLAQASLAKAEEQLKNVLNDFEGAQKRKIDQEIKVASLKSEMQRTESEHANALQATERQQREVMKHEDHLQSLTEQIQVLQEQLVGLKERKAALETRIEELHEDLISTRLGFESLQNNVRDLQVRSAQKSQEFLGQQKQVEMVTKQINDLRAQTGRMSEESEMYSSQMTESQYLLEERKLDFEKEIQNFENLKVRLSEIRETFEVESAKLREIEDELSDSQRAKNQRQTAMNEAQLKLGQARMKEQYLVEQIRERYMLDLGEVYGRYLEKEGDMIQAEIQLQDLKEKISKIGEVNLSAIQEYEEVSQRYEFLNKQYNDLIEAKEQLRKVIDRINRICSKRFKETFDLVNDRFKKVFPVLFGGGEAELILQENEEKNEMGIEIIARPPGKKMQNVSLMSGGEKALTAVSLVFSIFLVKPSPYCLLDEVDAPLDDANVYRFNELVKEMAKRSQIIVVTHNKHTMEVASRLYGVTMQERGVSTMVSVDVGTKKGKEVRSTESESHRVEELAFVAPEEPAEV